MYLYESERNQMPELEFTTVIIFFASRIVMHIPTFKFMGLSQLQMQWEIYIKNVSFLLFKVKPIYPGGHF